MYQDRIAPKANSIITHFKKPERLKHELRLPKEYRHFDELIQDNIDYISIDKQIFRDKAKYTSITINTPSMAVIIQKKKTHMELVQYLHAACFSPVRSTFARAIKTITSSRGQV